MNAYREGGHASSSRRILPRLQGRTGREGGECVRRLREERSKNRVGEEVMNVHVEMGEDQRVRSKHGETMRRETSIRNLSGVRLAGGSGGLGGVKLHKRKSPHAALRAGQAWQADVSNSNRGCTSRSRPGQSG